MHFAIDKYYYLAVLLQKQKTIKMKISNFNKRKNAFKNFLISSNVLKLSANKFQTQCTQYSKTFDLKCLFAYYKNEYYLLINN